MIELLNHALSARLSAPPDLSDGALLFALALAEWTLVVGPVVLVLLWILGGQQDRRAAVGACLAGLVALLVAAVVSSLYFHPRPFMDGLARNYLHHAPDSSFPSHHTTLFFALGFSLWIERPAILRRVGEGLLVLACAVGWARIYLGAHYPFDILGAAVIGFLSAMLFSIRQGRAVRNYATGLGEKLYALPFDLTGFRRR